MGKLSLNTSEGFVFRVKDRDDFLHPAFELRYNSVTDEYTVNEKPERMGWASGTYSAANVAKKVEHDWKMVYLARTESSEAASVGEVTWAIEVQDIEWTRISIRIEGIELEGASVRLTLLSIPSDLDLCHPSPGISLPPASANLESRCTFVSRLSLNTENTLDRREFPQDMTGFLIRAELTGGEGRLAWQKSQLFRQSVIHDRSKSTLVFQLFK